MGVMLIGITPIVRNSGQFDGYDMNDYITNKGQLRRKCSNLSMPFCIFSIEAA